MFFPATCLLVIEQRRGSSMAHPLECSVFTQVFRSTTRGQLLNHTMSLLNLDFLPIILATSLFGGAYVDTPNSALFPYHLISGPLLRIPRFHLSSIMRQARSIIIVGLPIGFEQQKLDFLINLSNGNRLPFCPSAIPNIVSLL